MTKDKINYCTKQDLYKYINKLRKQLGLNNTKYPIDFYEICCNMKNLKIELVNFSDKSLRGLSVPKEKIILLNSSRKDGERSFDCCHEFIHVLKHVNEHTQMFNCFDSVRANQNPYLEWQANEGSAELHVPYRKFIPLICKDLHDIKTSSDFDKLKVNLAEYFGVPETIIKLRIDNLIFEIDQYSKGVPLDSIPLKSNSQLRREGYNLCSLNTYFDFLV